jgi:haloacetate dehalogenase
MFDGFRLDRVDVGEMTLRVRCGGEGEPVVLLHGHPRTHTGWHRVAPRLSGSFVVVCPDLHGYGQSTLPPDAPGHARSSKRAMAGDVVALMRHLGHDRFPVAGHDPGRAGGLPHGHGSPGRSQAAGGHGWPAGDRASGAAERGVRAYLVALVVPGPDRQAGGGVHQR